MCILPQKNIPVKPFHKTFTQSQASSAAPMPHPLPSNTHKLSLSSQSSSAALTTHPTPFRPHKPSVFNQIPPSTNRVTPPPQPHTGTEQPGRRVLVGYDSAGGELILGWWKSALFYKSSLFERQQAASSDFWKTVLAEFRQPRSQPPTKPRSQPAPVSLASVRPYIRPQSTPQKKSIPRSLPRPQRILSHFSSTIFRYNS